MAGWARFAAVPATLLVGLLYLTLAGWQPSDRGNLTSYTDPSSPGRSGLQPGDRSDSLKGLSQQLRIGRRELAKGDSPLVVKLRMSLDSFAPGSDDAGLEDAFQGDPYSEDPPAVATPANATSAKNKKLLVIAVLTDPESLRTLGMAAYATWITSVKEFATVYYFVGSCDLSVSNFPGKVICLDTADAYPPQRKVFLLWTYLWRHHADEYHWFMKVDHDTYLNAYQISKLLDLLSSKEHNRVNKYIGMPALGRPQEREKLGLKGRPYCSGLGYLLNYGALNAIGPHTSTCLQNIVSNHSDTEVGRCVLLHAKCQCEGGAGFIFKQVYYQQDGDRVFAMKLVSGGQMKLTFPRYPKAIHFKAGLIHPLKRAEDFYRFHKQSVSQLRPVQPQISKEHSNPDSYRQALAELRTTCANNALRQLEKSSFYLKECTSPKATLKTTVPVDAYVLVRDVPEAARSFEETKGILAKNDIKAINTLVPGWKGEDRNNLNGGNRAYLEKMRELFKKAALAGTYRILIVEDKVVFMCEFKAQLWQLLQNHRCGGHLFTSHQGGVLLLGAHEVSPDGLEHIESDRSQAFSEYGHDVKAALCYNTNSKTRGSFGAVYHRSVFGEIMAWLQHVLSKDEPPPFDGVFMHLADKGYIVRAAFPNLVLRSLADKGSTAAANPKQIAVRLRWYEGSYCRADGSRVPEDTS